MPLEIENDGYRNRYGFIAIFESKEAIAAVDHEEALVGEVHIGEERVVRDEVGYRDRYKFREIT